MAPKCEVVTVEENGGNDSSAARQSGASKANIAALDCAKEASNFKNVP